MGWQISYPVWKFCGKDGPGPRAPDPCPALKGQSKEIFQLQFFFTKRLVLVSKDLPKSDFEFCQIFVELFVLTISKY
jgi:hypothetical protein